ncbi:MAG: Mbeg1-like protein [Treponemataceae bacterium]
MTENKIEQTFLSQKKEFSASILDYVLWRGDLTFEQSSFNEIDAAILTQLSYLKYEGLLDNSFDYQLELKELCRIFVSSPDYKKRSYNGPFINPATIDLFLLVCNSKRFEKVKVCNFKSVLDTEIEVQFAALTFKIFDSTIFVAFRGTHEEIVGWKEDFNMAFKFPVPAQIYSLDYLNTVGNKFKTKKIIVSGHSKGGNLAAYSSSFCNKEIKKRIETVYCLDSPGFYEKMLNDYDYIEIIPKICNIVPEKSVVGMLLDTKGNKKIVKSNRKSIMIQHDMFTWEVSGTKFEPCPKRSDSSLFVQKTLSKWLESMTVQQKEDFVNSVFGAIKASGAKTLSDLTENYVEYSPKILLYVATLDKTAKENVQKALSLLLKTTAANTSSTIKNKK